MRTRAGMVALVLAAMLSACSDDPEATPSDPMTEITVDCAQFAATTQKISDAQAELYAGTGGAEAIDTLVAELDALKDGAPEDVQTALTDMGEAFRDAQEILENPTKEKQAELAALAPKLSEDGQKITAYITSKCG